MRDEDFFYEGAERGDLLDALNGHAHDGATTVLEGEAGSGVSTLLGMLSMSLVGDFELIRLDGAEELGANAVVDAMLVHFDIERADLADTLKQTLADTSLVIVVDNAHLAPAEALATMGEEPPDVILADYHLENGETGFAAVEALRAASDRPVPAVMVTAHRDPAIARVCAAMDVHLLEKPVRPTELADMLGRLMA